jgi:glycosyltransferase involved in cell wall biosynthesis
MKLSIIIPAYNVEQYIGNCLDSIFNQVVDNNLLEVIVVNDGSKDRTEDIIKQYAAQHSNLIYNYQDNQGQSVARDVGLKKATGDLIWYVDSDDRTTENSIQTIFSYFEKYPHADFLTFDRIHNDLSEGTKKYCKSWGGRKTPKDIYEKPLNGFEANKYLVASVPWFHVFKRNYLIQNKLFFTPKLLNEDDELRMRLFFFAKEVRYIPFAHYIYSAMRPGSLTTVNQTFTMKSAESSIKSIETWENFKKEYAKTEEQKKYIDSFITNKYQSLVLLSAKDKDSDLYHLYVENKKKWRSCYKKTHHNSNHFSVISVIRYLLVLYYPKLYKYTMPSEMKKHFSSKK